MARAVWCRDCERRHWTGNIRMGITGVRVTKSRLPSGGVTRRPAKVPVTLPLWKYRRQIKQSADSNHRPARHEHAHLHARQEWRRYLTPVGRFGMDDLCGFLLYVAIAHGPSPKHTFEFKRLYYAAVCGRSICFLISDFTGVNVQHNLGNLFWGRATPANLLGCLVTRRPSGGW